MGVVRQDREVTYVADTIVAIATPHGRGGIGVVRLSGSRASEIGGKLLRLREAFAANKAQFGYLLDPDTRDVTVLDEVVATFFAGPKSYTGEDVLEIAMHGAPVVLEAALRGAVQQGARLAEPGEFTQRAFLSGRIDLTQAEAVHDLISATTLHQARMASHQLGGALSRLVRPVKENLVQLIATLEAGIDFAEDDLEVQADDLTAARIRDLIPPLSALEQSYRYGRSVREGLALAIIGRPNAGKSSLFNALLERDRAIVTATPGTTRDVISERADFAGIPVEITDTAGIREAGDEIEALGIARSREMLAEAALVLLVVDGTRDLDADDLALLKEVGSRPVLVAVNKCDLVTAADRARRTAQLHDVSAELTVSAVSAQTRQGLESLRERIHTALVGDGAALDSVFLTNERHHAAVVAAVQGLSAALIALDHRIPQEMVLLDLYTALNALDTLTGTTTTEDVLNLIFSTFCIGK